MRYLREKRQKVLGSYSNLHCPMTTIGIFENCRSLFFRFVPLFVLTLFCRFARFAQARCRRWPLCISICILVCFSSHFWRSLCRLSLCKFGQTFSRDFRVYCASVYKRLWQLKKQTVVDEKGPKSSFWVISQLRFDDRGTLDQKRLQKETKNKWMLQSIASFRPKTSFIYFGLLLCLYGAQKLTPPHPFWARKYAARTFCGRSSGVSKKSAPNSIHRTFSAFKFFLSSIRCLRFLSKFRPWIRPFCFPRSI